MVNEKEKIIKRALVTGGAGFIGSHLCERLTGMGIEVISLDDYSAGHIENLRKVHCKKVYGDVLNEYLVMDLMKDVDVVFHNAASKKTICIADPKHDLDVNAKGTLTLLTAALKQGVKKFIHASTGSVYGQPSCFPQDEDHPLRPISYYGVSKLAGERYVEMFYKLFGLDTTILRYFHVYGPRQANGKYGGVVAIFITGMLMDLPIFIHGDGSQERSFTYVKDIVDINLEAMKSPFSSGQVYNCASGLHVSVLDLHRELARQLDCNGKSPVYTESDLGEVFKFDVSNEKVKKDLKINFTSLDEGLRETISWFKVSA